MEPGLKPRAVELLTDRPVWAASLLEAIGQGKVSKEALNVNQVRKMLASKDAALAAKVKAAWGTVREGRNPAREQVVARMKAVLKTSPGDPSAGLQVFKKVCAQCHKIYGEGQEVGPDLTSTAATTGEQLLSNVFDPSLVIGSAYQATTVATARRPRPDRPARRGRPGSRCLEGSRREGRDHPPGRRRGNEDERCFPDAGGPGETAHFQGDCRPFRVPGPRQAPRRSRGPPASRVVLPTAFGSQRQPDRRASPPASQPTPSARMVSHSSPLPVAPASSAPTRSARTSPVPSGAGSTSPRTGRQSSSWTSPPTRVATGALVLKANGRVLHDSVVNAASLKKGWAHVEVDLTPFASRSVLLELENRANGWSWEFGYWGKVEVTTVAK